MAQLFRLRVPAGTELAFLVTWARSLVRPPAAPPAADLTATLPAGALALPFHTRVREQFDWQNVNPPNIPFKDVVIYEMSVRHFTADPSSGLPDDIRRAQKAQRSAAAPRPAAPRAPICAAAGRPQQNHHLPLT